MNQKILHTPEGVRDIYGGECERKKVLEGRLHQVLTSYGYQDIETPSFEYFDVFGSEVGTIPSKDLYKFFDREGSTLVLRPDFTPSVARCVSRYYEGTDQAVRLCYQGSTFVNYRSLQGRLKENTQMGAEFIGEGSADGDAEIIAMATEMLKTSGLQDFQISVGHIGFFEELAREAGFDEETADRLKELIHNHNTFGTEKFLSEMEIDDRIRKILVQLPTLNGGPDVLEKAHRLSEGLRAQKAVDRLLDVAEILKAYGTDRYVSCDFGLLPAYQYYTGIVFRGYTYGTGNAVVRGGRYDSLLKHFGTDRPAVGFVIVIGQLMNALSRQKIEILPEHERYAVVYTEASGIQAHRKAVQYRRQGKVTELVRVPAGFAGSLQDYAQKLQQEGRYVGVICV